LLISDLYPPFSTQQLALVSPDVEGSISLAGSTGTGKTSTAVARMVALARKGFSRGTVLILVPQRNLARSFYQAINSPDFPQGPLPVVLTIGGLSQRMVDLFWPLISGTAGFITSQNEPKFLTLETAQYYMAKLVGPMITAGEFQGLSLDPNRLYSQILDNLNKAAVIGFPHEEIGERLSDAWMGEPTQINHFIKAQEAATKFRHYCYQNNLLDFSLQIEVFFQHLWPSPLVRDYLRSQFSHLIFDNLEEDIPVTHDLVRDWMPEFDSALLIRNHNGGFRTFLGADPSSANTLAETCLKQYEFEENFQENSKIAALGSTLGKIIKQETLPPVLRLDRECFEIRQYRFSTEMVENVCLDIQDLLDSGKAQPGEIVIISPYLSDALRFSIQRKLEVLGIANRSTRPSRSLRSEPTVRTLLTLAKIAYPSWKLPITPFEVREMLLQVITNGDLNRADLLAKIIAPQLNRTRRLVNFSELIPEMQSRVTFVVGERYEIMRAWLENAIGDEVADLDVYFGKVFGELLAQKEFGFQGNMESAALIDQLITSARKFRHFARMDDRIVSEEVGKEYILMVESGVLAAQYLSPQDNAPENVVLLAPAYSFLMANRAVGYQFWLDAGSHGWWERLFQPLTQPYILSRQWPRRRKWTDADEFASNQESMARLVYGLLERCTGKVYFCTAGLNENGMEEKGWLLQCLQTLLKRLPAKGSNDV
jgi:hypothetical protein